MTSRIFNRLAKVQHELYQWLPTGQLHFVYGTAPSKVHIVWQFELNTGDVATARAALDYEKLAYCTTPRSLARQLIKVWDGEYERIRQSYGQDPLPILPLE